MFLGIDANQLRDQAGKHSVLANPEGPGIQLVFGPMDRNKEYHLGSASSNEQGMKSVNSRSQSLNDHWSPKITILSMQQDAGNVVILVPCQAIFCAFPISCGEDHNPSIHMNPMTSHLT